MVVVSTLAWRLVPDIYQVVYLPCPCLILKSLQNTSQRSVLPARTCRCRPSPAAGPCSQCTSPYPLHLQPTITPTSVESTYSSSLLIQSYGYTQSAPRACQNKDKRVPRPGGQPSPPIPSQPYLHYLPTENLTFTTFYKVSWVLITEKFGAQHITAIKFYLVFF